MRKWVFDDTPGKFDLDLSHSFVQCGRLSDLRVPAELELNYGADRGTAALRELIAQLYTGSPDQVLVAHGAEEALLLLYSTLLRAGDQLITFRPGWQQSWDAPAMFGCRVDAIELDGDFDIEVAAVAELATDRLRMIVVNTPCNPTGRRVRPDELEGLRRLAERHDAYLVLDEEYEYDLSRSRAVHDDRIISISGLSKVFGYPGLRVGWLYATADIVEACADRKYLTSIANSVLCEALACDVLSRREEYLAEYHRQVETGTQILTEWVAGHPGVLRLTPPEGTPFGWVHLVDGGPSLPFCRAALERGVLLMPGETLGAVSGFRVGLAIPPRDLSDGLRRMDYVLCQRDTMNGAFRNEHAPRFDDGAR